MGNAKGAGKHQKVPNRKNRKDKNSKKNNRNFKRNKKNNQLIVRETENNLFMNLDYDILSYVLDFSKDSKNSKMSQNFLVCKLWKDLIFNNYSNQMDYNGMVLKISKNIIYKQI